MPRSTPKPKSHSPSEDINHPLGFCPKCRRPRVREAWRQTPYGVTTIDALRRKETWGWVLICPRFHLESLEHDDQSTPPSQRVIDETIERRYGWC
jgi:hypothetical protein